MKNDVNVPSKSNKQNNFFVDVLKVSDETIGFGSESGSEPIIQRYGSADPDRIRTKISWIRNTGIFTSTFVLQRRGSLCSEPSRRRPGTTAPSPSLISSTCGWAAPRREAGATQPHPRPRPRGDLPGSAADPNPDPPDPRVFGPPGSGSGSISQRCGSRSGSGSGSGSFYH